MTTSKDRAMGALSGLAVGDAVGTTLEFRTPGTFTPIDDMVGGGPFRLDRGQWTDDTSMAMCLAESILDTGTLDPQDQLRRYVMWREDGYWSSTGRCFDIGTTTTNALRRFKSTGQVTDSTVNPESAANGSLMRLAPVPIRWFRDIETAQALSGESSLTTHSAPRPVDSCRVFGAMIAALIQGVDADEVLSSDFWQYGPLDPQVEAVTRGSWRDIEPPQIKGSGFVIHALEAAIWAVAGAEDFRDAVLRAANLGDDADTTAAIAGQLAGARWGYSAIPQDWRDAITFRHRIAAIGSALHDVAGDPTVGDLWAHDSFVHGYWVQPGTVLAGEYPGNENPEVARAKINLLLDSGIRTFVDLTNDDGLAPYHQIAASAADERGLEVTVLEHPIPDMGVIDDAGYRNIVNAIQGARDRGGVYFHCWGGIGRTGTVAGCLLRESGLNADDALARLRELRAPTRKARMTAPQTAAQRQVVERYKRVGSSH